MFACKIDSVEIHSPMLYILSLCMLVLKKDQYPIRSNKVEFSKGSLLTVKDYPGGVKNMITFTVNVGWLFCFCLYADQFLQSLEEIGYSIHQHIELYRVPTVSIQNDLRLTIQIIQKDVYLRIFGNSRCKDECFKKVD